MVSEQLALVVDMLHAGKRVKLKDLTDFDKVQIIMAR